MRDEETQVNITVLEMLRQFFGIDIKGLDPVPEDENGVDLPLIFSTIRQGIMARSRWDIEEYAFIGQFSFNRFIMWNDIRNRADELAQNKVVASLISGKTEWAGDDLYISPLDLDNKVAPTDLVVPLSADSSQLAAVYAASQGKSFVLHGPPGSGKSQTITNMIASALYQGKSVLFVAEKMAALSVVEKRLNKVGLGPFCIELHSNKAQKRAVLSQLEETLNVGRIKKPAEYKAQADKIAEMRRELNGTMEEIHKKRNFGCSMYDAAVRYEKNRSFGGKFALHGTARRYERDLIFQHGVRLLRALLRQEGNSAMLPQLLWSLRAYRVYSRNKGRYGGEAPRAENSSCGCTERHSTDSSIHRQQRDDL